jgi:hypothetical protein
MKYVEAPERYSGFDKSLFLAGGITGCPGWQKELVESLENENIVLMNPRRADFPIHDPKASFKQIHWEHDHLRKADGISFWFPKEALCPIALYELGAWSMSNKPIFVGVDPDYQRRQDVEIQTELARSGVEIVYDLNSLSEQIKDWVRN